MVVGSNTRLASEPLSFLVFMCEIYQELKCVGRYPHWAREQTMVQELSFRGEACISGTCKGRDDDVYDEIDDFDLREGATNGDRVSRQIQV